MSTSVTPSSNLEHPSTQLVVPSHIRYMRWGSLGAAILSAIFLISYALISGPFRRTIFLILTIVFAALAIGLFLYCRWVVGRSGCEKQEKETDCDCGF